MKDHPAIFLLRSPVGYGELSQDFTWSLARVRLPTQPADPYIAFATEQLGFAFLEQKGIVDSGLIVVSSKKIDKSTYVEAGAVAVLVSSAADLALFIESPESFTNGAQLVPLTLP